MSELSIMKRFAMVAATLLLVPATSAQTVTEMIEVTVANVEVVVLDREGNTVEGLSADDFELFVDGERKPLSNFYAETMDATEKLEAPEGTKTAPESSAAKRSTVNHLVMLYIDESAPSHRESDPSLRRHFAGFFETLTSSCVTCRVSIHSRRGSKLERLTGPTDDPELLATLFRDELRRSFGPAFATRRALETGDPVIRHMIRQRETRRQAAALGELLGSAMDTPGRKVLLLLTNQPVNAFAASASALLTEESNSLDLPRDLTSSSLEALANAAGISVYPIIAGGLRRYGEDFTEIGGLPQLPSTAISSTVSGLVAGVSGIAAATGGRAHPATSNFEVPLGRIATELRSYYSLGFRSDGSRPSRVEVRVRGREDLEVRARRTTRALSEEERTAIAFGASQPQDAGGPVAIDAKLVQNNRGFRRNQVRLAFAFPLDQLVWVASGEGERAETRILFKAVGDSGRISDVEAIPLTLRRRAGDPETMFSDEIDLLLRSERQDLIMALQDMLSGTISWTTVRME